MSPTVASGDLPDDVLVRVRSICTALPEVVEEAAWAGIRWTVRRRNFTQVVGIADGWPPVYARAAGTNGPACMVTFRCPPDDVEAFRAAGPPFSVPVWFPNIIGLVLDDATDWDEVAELITESYRVLAPRGLAEQVGPGEPSR